ncbi:hypothetical protein ACFO0N_07685 [Halobium salinum]|uniref:Uncharacterized protein n=1 Tax=Halobium salinum TaxID=1364940 RepID=A0ABD5PAA4_9EURY|nr:hypothetical protein [Halobium salinum]
MGDSEEGVDRGDEYRHADGSREIVFETAEGRVLCVREYPSVDAFRTAVEDAEYVGVDRNVADLPDVEEFETE